MLLDLAEASLREGLASGRPATAALSALPPGLRRAAASFVTLRRGRNLRGCIGSAEPRRPLADDVTHNAYRAAFGDPRFPPLARRELPGLRLEVSVLGPHRTLSFADEEALCGQLRPHTHGLLIECGARRALFLPAVWREIPEPQRFLALLKRKAGLPAGFWSRDIRARVFSVQSFARSLRA